MFWNIQSLKVFTRCSLATSSGTQQELQQHSYFVNSLAILVFIIQELLWDDSKNDLEYIRVYTVDNFFFFFFFCSLYYMVPEDHIALSSYYSSCVGLVCSSVVQSVSSHNSTVIPWGWEQACVSLITFAALVVEEIFIYWVWLHVLLQNKYGTNDEWSVSFRSADGGDYFSLFPVSVARCWVQRPIQHK